MLLFNITFDKNGYWERYMNAFKTTNILIYEGDKQIYSIPLLDSFYARDPSYLKTKRKIGI